MMSNNSNIVLANLSFDDDLVFGGIGGGTSGCGSMMEMLMFVRLVIVVVVTIAVATALVEMKLLYFEVHHISSRMW